MQRYSTSLLNLLTDWFPLPSFNACLTVWLLRLMQKRRKITKKVVLTVVNDSCNQIWSNSQRGAIVSIEQPLQKQVRQRNWKTWESSSRTVMAQFRGFQTLQTSLHMILPKQLRLPWWTHPDCQPFGNQQWTAMHPKPLQSWQRNRQFSTNSYL